ncbi:hypothetical protein [Flexivirga caeni]|uniref:Uncharacterized protein n=1 Tax=Flexivirga caeni TaxID=2294115 RepID=A0A3M9LYD0_9MICO|nr:hypothetical protein [Flexivirga caeni]RNI18304.1 hypothetical protein EFY87_18070 [Flexivirga caeni]
MPLTDHEIEQLTVPERLDLMRRLRESETLDAVRAPWLRTVRRRRAIALAITAVCAVFLVPWTAYLALSLPDHYVSHAWALTWAGFDVLLIVMLGLTAFFAWKRRMLLVLTSFAAGVLLLADAWFDVTTANRHSVAQALASAIFVEVPLAVFLIWMGVAISGRAAGLLNAVTGQGFSGKWRMPINADVMNAEDRELPGRRG